MHSRRPISGKTVLVTRSVDQFEEFAQIFRDRGAHAISHPVIELTPPADWKEIDRAIAELQDQQYDWLIFTSSNGVRFFFDRLSELNQRPDFSRLKIAAVGPRTAGKLMEKGLIADWIPRIFEGASLARELAAKGSEQKSSRFLALRADRADCALSEGFRQSGISMRDVIVYCSVDRQHPDPEICKLLEESKIDWITVTSPAIARNTIRLFGSLLRKARLVSISPKTSQILKSHGFPPAAEARSFDRNGLLEAMEGFEVRG